MSGTVLDDTGEEAAARLLRIAACLRARRLPEEDDADHHADGIERRWWHEGAPLEQALGLGAAGRGKPGARRALLLADRDDAVHRLAEMLGGETGSADSEAVWNVAEALEAFAFSWPLYRTALECPSRLQGKPQGLCWTIMRATGGKAISRRWIAAILARN